MKRLFLILSLNFLFLGIVFGQSFTASVDRTTVGLGENFQLQFNISTNNPNSVRNFRPPSFSNFFVLSGPNQSTSMNIINGKMSANISYSYILQPRNPGTATIGSGTIEVEGKELNTQPITLTITRTSTQQKTPSGQQKPTESTVDLGQNIFLKAIIDKTRVYQGEQINVTFKLYISNVGISNYSVSKTPSLKGFWTEEFELGQQVTLNTEVVNGKQYKVGTIRKLALFPTQSGSLEIDPMELQCILQVRAKKKRSNDLFDNFFGDDPFFNPMTNVEYKLKSSPVKITVDPLPLTNIPESFKGLVGKFSIESSISKNNPKVNEPVTLKLKITGQGNIKLIPTPEINLPVDLEKYDPKINDNITKGPIISGTRTIDYLFIPRYPGEKKIPSIEFSYFDLYQKKYITQYTPEYTLNVEQGNQPLVSSNVNREDIKMLGQDIHFIKIGDLTLTRRGPYFYNSILYYLLYLIPIAIMIGLLIIRKKLDKDRSDLIGLKFRKANKIAIKRLAKAKKLLDAKKPTEFYDEISKAVWGYVSDKLKIPTSEISIEVVITNLESMNINREIIDKTKSCLDLCEFARFGPNSETMVEMGRVYDESKESIIQIERSFGY